MGLLGNLPAPADQHLQTGVFIFGKNSKNAQIEASDTHACETPSSLDEKVIVIDMMQQSTPSEVQPSSRKASKVSKEEGKLRFSKWIFPKISSQTNFSF